MVALPGHFRWLNKEHVFYLRCDMVGNQPHTVLDEDAVRNLNDTLQNKANSYYNDSKLLAGCMFDLTSPVNISEVNMHVLVFIGSWKMN